MILSNIGAAATIGGGIIAQNAQNKAERNWNRRADAAREEPQIITNTVDLKRLRSDAEEAGFNPLTVLRAGGLAGYNIQQHPNLHPLPNVNHGASPLGNAISGLGSQIFGMGADMALAGVNAGYQRELQAAAFAGMPSGRTLGGAPVSMSYDGPVRSANGGAISSGDHIGVNTHDQWEQEIPGVTNPFGWDWWESNPYFADVETGGEARYGDFGAIPISALTYAADIAWNATRGVDALRGTLQSWHSSLTTANDVPWNPYETGGGLSLNVGGPRHGTMTPVP